MYIDENALYGKTSYPSLFRYETEIIEMLVDLLNGPNNSGGSLTTGGTESNIIAMNTAREWANEHKPEICSPEIIVPRTAHPSFEKGAKIQVFDPEAMPNIEKRFGNRLNYSESMYAALENADALLICTEWSIFRTPDFSKIKQKLKYGKLITYSFLCFILNPNIWYYTLK